LRAVDRRGVDGECLGALAAQAGDWATALMTSWPEWPLSSVLQTACPSLAARAALGGVIPSACS